MNNNQAIFTDNKNKFNSNPSQKEVKEEYKEKKFLQK